MYLLDTNHISFIFIQQDPGVIKHLESLPTNSKLAINAIVYGELIYMVSKSEKRIQNRSALDHFIQDLNIEIHPLDEITSEIYGQLHAQIHACYAPKDKKQRRKYRISEAGVRLNDLWIACTAIEHGLIIVSQDSDFESINRARNLDSKLNLECWKIPTASTP